MSKITGTVRRSDLEGGGWVLEAEDGERYQLRGDCAGLKDGMKARVEGKVEKDVMGIGMMGPSFAVSKVTAID